MEEIQLPKGEFIIKVQLPIESNVPNPEILIYNRNSAAFLRRRFQPLNDDP